MAGRSDTPLSSTSLHNQPQSGKPQKATVFNKMESGIPRVETPSGRTDHSATRAPLASKRPVKEHSFLTDVADVRAMEQGLVHLLEDFHSGKLQAFGGDCMFDRMDQIREQQEHLARLHFELDLQHNVLRLDSEDSRRAAGENLGKLIGQLQVLSSSIQTLKKSDGQSTKKPENE